jgi:hypothetical protein
LQGSLAAFCGAGAAGGGGKMPASPLYERDFYAWANEQAALLRAGKIGEADIEHIAEEIESMGRTEKRKLISRFTVLMLHLIKWRYQPGLRARHGGRPSDCSATI